ncbi:hypothetical protein DV737_g3253, partial [Chaetothyriales sp. CBS 132003]
MDPSTSQAGVSAAPAAASFIPSGTYLVNMRTTAANLTSAYLRTPANIDWTRIPIQLFHQIDPAVLLAFPRKILQATGLVEDLGHAASGFKSYLGMLQYLTSRWAFTCFAMALILNRISVYGASRRRIVLRWTQRLALRMIPMLLLLPQIYRLLCGIRCQTSPHYSLYRHGDNDRYSPLDWSTDGGLLYRVSSAVLYASTDEQACAAVGMSRRGRDVPPLYGSFALLWPSFLSLSVAHLAESLSCSLQQQPLMTEVGMSIFEHSLAFAEAETMITTTLVALASKAKAQNATHTAKFSGSEPAARGTIVASGTIMALSDALRSLTGPHVLDRVNVPVEVLLVALLSCCNALSSTAISVLGKQRKWRLANTAFWGLCFMASFTWAFACTSIMSRAEDADTRPVSSLLHFPTVAIVGFLPHMAILAGIGVCMAIYAVALALTAFSLDSNPSIPHPASFRQRLAIAHDNLQAALQVRGITIHWHEDFYTALLRVGFAALTAASEAVFLHEGRSVEMRQFTWLEEERLDELQLSRSSKQDDVGDAHFQIVEEYGVPSSSPGAADKGGIWKSGYAKERKFGKNKDGQLEGRNSFAYPAPRPGGIGAVQRTTRFYLLFIYLRGIIFLVGGWIGYAVGLLLDRVGVTSRPRWLRRMVGQSLKGMQHERDNMAKNDDLLDFWLIKDDEGNVPTSDSVDVEVEMRRKVESQYGQGEAAERVLDESLYGWWKAGGWFGLKDGSGSYAPSLVDDDQDDVTSELSIQVKTTRTRRGRSNSRGREETPESMTESPFDAATLARLLNPRDAASREEARILSAHLSTLSDDSASAGRIMTRSRYKKERESERARVLLAGRRTSTKLPAVSLYRSSVSTGPLSAVEEEDALEALILSRRRKPHSTFPHISGFLRLYVP